MYRPVKALASWPSERPVGGLEPGIDRAVGLLAEREQGERGVGHLERGLCVGASRHMQGSGVRHRDHRVQGCVLTSVARAAGLDALEEVVPLRGVLGLRERIIAAHVLHATVPARDRSAEPSRFARRWTPRPGSGVSEPTARDQTIDDLGNSPGHDCRVRLVSFR